MENQKNIYNVFGNLDKTKTAAAVALELIGKACSASDETNKIAILDWVIEGDNLTKQINYRNSKYWGFCKAP